MQGRQTGGGGSGGRNPLLNFLIVLVKNSKKWTFLKIDPGCVALQPPLNFAEFGAPVYMYDNKQTVYKQKYQKQSFNYIQAIVQIIQFLQIQGFPFHDLSSILNS